MVSRALGNVFQLSDVINVKDPRYGARGNGITDDSAAIQAAVTAACAAFRPVFFPPATSYLLNTGITLTRAIPLIGYGETFEEGTAQLDFRGTGNAITLTQGGGSVNWRVKGLLISTGLNSNTGLTAIYVTNGLVGGKFEDIKITGDNANTNLDYGIRIRGNAAGANATVNRFDNVYASRCGYGIAVGDDVASGMGSNTTIIGGIILSARNAAILLTGGQNQILGGDHSAVGVGVVVLFDGAQCQNNSVISTEMEMAAGSSHIKFANNAGVGHVLNIVGGRGLTTGVGDTGITVNDTAGGAAGNRYTKLSGLALASLFSVGATEANAHYLSGGLATLVEPGLTRYAGSPETHVTAPKGSLCVDTTNGKLYVKEANADATGWVLK